MPPRSPKIYFLQLKTHKLSIHLIIQPTTTLSQLKQEAFEALTSDVAEPLTRAKGVASPDDTAMDADDSFDIGYMHDTGLPPTAADVVPCIRNLEDFELCRAIKEKGRTTRRYEVLLPNEMQVHEVGISGWEVLFIQFRDQDTGDLLPPTYTLPPVDEDEQDMTPPVLEPEPSSTAIGKRKARGED